MYSVRDVTRRYQLDHLKHLNTSKNLEFYVVFKYQRDTLALFDDKGALVKYQYISRIYKPIPLYERSVEL